MLHLTQHLLRNSNKNCGHFMAPYWCEAEGRDKTLVFEVLHMLPGWLCSHLIKQRKTMWVTPAPASIVQQPHSYQVVAIIYHIVCFFKLLFDFKSFCFSIFFFFYGLTGFTLWCFSCVAAATSILIHHLFPNVRLFYFDAFFFQKGEYGLLLFNIVS